MRERLRDPRLVRQQNRRRAGPSRPKGIDAILDKYLARTRVLNVAATKKLEQTWIAKIRMKI
jgi:hypothetical protein